MRRRKKIYLNKKERAAGSMFIVILIIIIAIPKKLKIIGGIILSLICIIIAIKKIYKHYQNKKKRKTPKKTVVYGLRKKVEHLYTKRPLMTDCEKQFLFRLERIFKDIFIIQPQIPLRMIVKKNDDSYANELNRYIDFGLLDNNRELIALIELNDKSHLNYERVKRDRNVTDICEKIGIPLVTFWTEKEYLDEEIFQRVILIIEGYKNGYTKDN